MCYVTYQAGTSKLKDLPYFVERQIKAALGQLESSNKT